MRQNFCPIYLIRLFRFCVLYKNFIPTPETDVLRHYNDNVRQIKEIQLCAWKPVLDQC